MSQGAAPRMHLKLPRLGVLRLRQWSGFTRGHHPSQKEVPTKASPVRSMTKSLLPGQLGQGPESLWKEVAKARTPLPGTPASKPPLPESRPISEAINGASQISTKGVPTAIPTLGRISQLPEILIFFTVLLVLLVTWTLTLMGSPW